MITIITGVPGSGKTLRALSEVKALADKDNRPVFQSGIPDLALPWEPIDPAKWYEAPTGAIILIDECQTVFRPRAASSAVPEAVSRLETHRHDGHDLFLVTQHPMLVDPNIRRLVGRHLHVNRRYGLARATILEFPSCKDQPLSKKSEARRHEWAFPKEAYTWYKSAEVHTHKVSIPPKIIMLFLIPLFLLALGWFMWDRWESKIHAKPSQVKGLDANGMPTDPDAIRMRRDLDFRFKKAPDSGPASGAETQKKTVGDYMPRVAGLAHTAPVYDEITKPVRAPYPAACVSIRGACKCYTSQGTVLAVPQPLCLEIVAKGYFVDFDDGRRERDPHPVVQSSPAPLSLAAR